MSIASAEVRERAIGAYRSGKGTQEQVAEMFGVCARTFERWWQAYRREGRVAPLPRGHYPSALDEEAMARLDGLLEAQPDLTLEQLRDTKARTQQTLDEAIAHELAKVTPQDARAWFNASGYPTCQN